MRFSLGPSASLMMVFILNRSLLLGFWLRQPSKEWPDWAVSMHLVTWQATFDCAYAFRQPFPGNPSQRGESKLSHDRTGQVRNCSAPRMSACAPRGCGVYRFLRRSRRGSLTRVDSSRPNRGRYRTILRSIEFCLPSSGSKEFEWTRARAPTP